jgi:hypothetical protein
MQFTFKREAVALAVFLVGPIALGLVVALLAVLLRR